MDLDLTGTRVLFVTPECAPLPRPAGSATSAPRCPPALRALGVDVRVLMPGYPEVLAQVGRAAARTAQVLGHEVGCSKARLPTGAASCCSTARRSTSAAAGRTRIAEGADWPDNALRFGVLSRCRAAGGGRLAARLAAATSCIATTGPRRWPPRTCASSARAAGSLVTIHNLAFQGLFEREWSSASGCRRKPSRSTASSSTGGCRSSRRACRTRMRSTP